MVQLVLYKQRKHRVINKYTNIYFDFKIRMKVMSEISDSQPTIIKTSRGLSIAGTRLTLSHIMDYLKADWPPQLIQQWLDLTDKQIADVMDYIYHHQDEVEVEYQQVLQLAEESRQYWEAYNQERFAQIAASPPEPGREAIRAKIDAKKAALGMT